jgi:hypothetical protein
VECVLWVSTTLLRKKEDGAMLDPTGDEDTRDKDFCTVRGMEKREEG